MSHPTPESQTPSTSTTTSTTSTSERPELPAGIRAREAFLAQREAVRGACSRIR
jgi:hypothetical protein